MNLAAKLNMADQERTLEVLSKFELQTLNEEWVKSTWDSDFTEIETLNEIQDELQGRGYHTETLKELQNVLDDWISHKESQDGEGLWTILVENQISQKRLICLFAYLIHIGKMKTADSYQKTAGILSGSNYLKLLAVPGSVAFKVFNPVLYEKVVDLMKMWMAVGTSKRKKNMSTTMSQKSKKSKGNKTRQQDPTIDINQDFDASDEDDEVGECSPQEMTSLRKSLLSLLKDLVFLLETTPIRQSEASLYHTVQILARLTQQDTELFDGIFPSNCPTFRLPLPGLAYKGLTLLCKPLQGHVVTLFRATCKNLLPNLLMLQGENKVSAQTIPKHVQVIREHAVNFICYMLDEGDARELNSVRTLLQHMCTKVPDKVEYRTKVSQSIVKILGKLPSKSYCKMVEWFYLLSKNQKINNRAFVLEIVSSLLLVPEREVDEETPAASTLFVKHNSLLKLLLERCSDSAPTVRARAIAAFAQCFQSSNLNIKDSLKSMVTPMGADKPTHHRHLIPTPDLENRAQAVTEQTTMEQTINRTAPTDQQPPEDVETPAAGQPPANPNTPFLGVPLTPFNPNLQDSDGVMSMLRRRARDEKVNVRKAALQALENIIRFEAPDFRRENLDLLVERCRDPALSARKQALQSLTELLLDMPSHQPVQQAWLDGVIPLVIDRETTLQEKCLDTIEEIIIHNIVPFSKSSSQSHKLAWDILMIIERNENVELRRYLQKACIHWSRQGKIKQKIISALETHIDTPNSEAAWMLLAEIAPAAPKLGHNFITEFWDRHGSVWNETNYSILQRVLTVMTYAAKHIQQDDRSKIIESLINRLMRFDSAPELIAVTIKALSKMCDAEATEKGENNTQSKAWCVSLIQASDNYLSHVILNQEGGIENEDMVICHLFTLGEVVQICPAQVPKRIFLIVQSMVAAPCISPMSSSQSSASQGDCGTEKNTSEHSDGIPSTQTSTHESETSNSQGSENQPPSSQSSQNSDPGLSSQNPSSQLTQASQPFTQFKGSKMSNRIRAFAFIALGKLCLQNSDLAKKCVAALARELETSNDSAIRNNVVIILCDLCVRYTTTADRYVSNIAACLKDESALVRKQTLTVVTRLLQEDFIKLKGVLFFRMITTLLDHNKDIAEFAEFCLIHILLTRHPNMFFHHFMECIFLFNAYQDFGAYNKFTESEREKKLFRLHGKTNIRLREKLYLFMLEHMVDEHRFQMTAKICQDILGGFVDGDIPLNDDSAAVLRDSLAILSSKEIKLSSLNAKANDDVAGDEQEMAAVVIATAKKTLITQVVKKNVIENTIPIVISLKHMLQKHRSPVLRDLMGYLRELMKDYKTEVQDILVADRQLASEIEYDLKRFEEDKEDAQAPVNTPVRTPTTSGPSTDRPSQSLNNSKVAMSPNVSIQRTRTSITPQSPHQNAEKSITDVVLKSPVPVQAVPARHTPLSNVAIMNSARKAFQRAQLRRSISESPSKSVSSPQRRFSAARSISDIAVVGTDDDQTPGVEGEERRTPRRGGNAMNRAISTPSGVLQNITFHMDHNITMIPPSPIPSSMPIRVFPEEDSGTLVTPKKKMGRTEKVAEDAIFMFSPEKPLPKPRMWNVKCPNIEGQPTSAIEDGVNEDVLLNLSQTAKNTNQATRRSRSTATAGRRSSSQSRKK